MALHTRGDIAEAVEHLDLAAAMHILENLYERGPDCIAWGDESVSALSEPSDREQADDERQTLAEEHNT